MSNFTKTLNNYNSIMKYFILTFLLFVNNVFSETKAEYTVDITFIEMQAKQM